MDSTQVQSINDAELQREDVVSDIELQALEKKARQYVFQAKRFTFFSVELEIETDNDKQVILYQDGDICCACTFWLKWRTCIHTMTARFLIEDLLTLKKGRYAAIHATESESPVNIRTLHTSRS